MNAEPCNMPMEAVLTGRAAGESPKQMESRCSWLIGVAANSGSVSQPESETGLVAEIGVAVKSGSVSQPESETGSVAEVGVTAISGSVAGIGVTAKSGSVAETGVTAKSGSVAEIGVTAKSDGHIAAGNLDRAYCSSISDSKHSTSTRNLFQSQRMSLLVASLVSAINIAIA